MLELPKEKTKAKKDFGEMFTLIYGEPKVGKSTFCSHIPNALFLASEEGQNFLDVYKVKIASWKDILEVGKALSKSEHNYKTLIFDVTDKIWSFCEKFVCEREGVKSISDLAFGKGYALAKDQFSSVMDRFAQMGLGIVFLSHASEKEQKTKSVTVTVMQPSLPKTAQSVVNGMCDFILYSYISSEGKRLMRTKPNKHVIAGDRSGTLPEIMDFDYKSFITELNKAIK